MKKIQGGRMRYLRKILLCTAIVGGLALTGTLFAAPQKIAKQKSKSVTKIDQMLYKQKVAQLRDKIRRERQNLKTDSRQFGKGTDAAKFDKQQLRKDNQELKRLQKDRALRKSPKVRKKDS
ncbi:MAG: hypothetical protein ABSH28_24470 [Acidobacteriota bacterium]